MSTERKRAQVAALTEKLSRMQFAVVADYRGMTVADITTLRQKLYESGAEVLVAKNTLVRLAARETGHEAIESLLAGPTALAISYDDVAATAKALNEYVKAPNNKFEIRGGILGTTLLAADALEQVSKMPSREQVLAQVVGGIQAPLSGVVGVLSAPASDVVGCVQSVVTNVLYALQARVDQLQAAGESA